MDLIVLFHFKNIAYMRWAKIKSPNLKNSTSPRHAPPPTSTLILLDPPLYEVLVYDANIIINFISCKSDIITCLFAFLLTYRLFVYNEVRILLKLSLRLYDTIGDSEIHVSLRSLSFIRRGQYFINFRLLIVFIVIKKPRNFFCFSQSCRDPSLSWITLIILCNFKLFISRSS